MSAQQYYQNSAPPQPQQSYQPPNQQYAFNNQPNGFNQPNNSYNNQGGPGGNDWSMKPSQPYANTSFPPPHGAPHDGGQSYPPPSSGTPGDAEYGGGNKYGDTAPFSQATEKTGARFRPKNRLKDPIFLVLFIAAVAGWAVLSAIALRSFTSVDGLGGGFGNSMQGGTGTSITLDR